MRKSYLKLTSVLALSCTALLIQGVQAGVSGNIGFASNYIWRGLT